jgi:PDZ domain-containing protein
MVVAAFAIGDDRTVTSSDPFRSVPRVAPPRTPPRVIIMSVSGSVMALLLSLLTIIPLPYLVERPGPTFDLFDGNGGTGEGMRLSLSGIETYPPSGDLMLTTVSVQGGSWTDIKMGGLIRAWFEPAATVQPEIYFPYDEEGSSQDDWRLSQESATVAALAYEGISVPMAATITDIDISSNARGRLRVDDVIVAINGMAISTYEDLRSAFDPLEPGDEVTVTVDRAGREVTVSFDTISDGAGKAIMGIWFVPDFAFPFDVSVDIDNVSGPSGGMMFALGIIDLLTPEDELRGQSVAGTGTISIDGTVGPIGGIDLKMLGAVSDGAQWFLAPESNCPEVVGKVPDGLAVVSVSNLDEAYDAIVAIGEGRTDALPSCG